MIDKIKQISNTTENDIKLSLYINIATRLIFNYINNKKLSTDYIKKEYEDVIILIVTNALSFNNDGIKQITEGDTSVTYCDNKAFCITDDIKNLLPVPYMKMR